MLKKLLKKLLNHFGKTYNLDNNIPNQLILSVLVRRMKMMLRGLIKVRRNIFLGSNVKIYNKHNFKFGKGCTIEKQTTLDCYAIEKVVFGDTVKIGAFSTLSTTSHLSKLGKGLSIGDFSAIGEYSYFGCYW